MRHTIIALIAILFFIGCTKVLDVQDLNSLNSAYVWDDENLADSYLIDLYAALQGWPKMDQKVFSDEMLGVFTPGLINEENDDYFYWPYDEIRKINILLTEIDKGSINDEIKNKIKAQAHFLRAWHYFKMVVYHGGVPIIEKPQSLEDNLYVARNSTKETFNFIISDLDYAIDNLTDRSDASELGRIDKSISKAFKARVLLYEASPQFNPGNPYDNSFWANAYAVNKEAKEFLESQGFGLYEDYNNIWADEGNKEVVFPVVFTEGYFSSGTNLYLKGRREDLIRPYSVGLRGTRIEMPIWQLVQAFPMKDGFVLGDSNSKYSYDLQTFWKDRDPRFYNIIAYNGSLYNGGISSERRQYTDRDVATQSDSYSIMCAGFYNKKALNLELGKGELQKNGTDWVEIRFAEVLLNFAETACETGHENEAVDALKQIRQRAGFVLGSNGLYGIKENLSREELREAILAERRIEFAFEGKRFWDLRRTRNLSLIDGLHKQGCKATIKDPERISEGKTWKLLPEDFSYEVEDYIYQDYIMSVPEKYYFFPILKIETERNSNLEQNLGWSGGTFDPTLN